MAINFKILAIIASVLLVAGNYSVFVTGSEDVIDDEVNPVNNAAEEIDENERAERSPHIYGQYGGYPRSQGGYVGGHNHNHGGAAGGGYGVPFSINTGHNFHIIHRPTINDITKVGYNGHRFKNPFLKVPILNVGCPVYQPSMNMEVTCINNTCENKCQVGYKFPNGEISFKLICMGQEWASDHKVYGARNMPLCQATCLPSCKNKGVCVRPNTCECGANYHGVYCQYEKSTCKQISQAEFSSKYIEGHCSESSCTIRCHRRFKFADGSDISNLECKKYQWTHTKTGLPGIPECKPTCNPACINGGQCISVNYCQCPKNYHGDHCQNKIPIGSCSVPSQFNLQYKCASEKSFKRCNFTCHTVPGLKVEGSLDIEYVCNYTTNEFKPTLPKCVYPPSYTIRQGKETKYYVKKEGSSVHKASHSHSVEYFTEQEDLLAIITKYKNYERRTEWFSSEESFATPSSYFLYVTSDTDVLFDNTPKPAKCTTWGGINMKTFDGLIFRAPLSCSHTLINDKEDATFYITLKACPHGSGYGCAHTLEIYWQSVVYTFKNLNGTVQLSTSSKNLPIPVQVMGMKVLPIAQNLQIDLGSVGLNIEWDKKQYVAVHAGPGLWAKVGGLCGSLDGDYRNDLMSQRGVVLETIKAFTDAWRVKDSSEFCGMENSVELALGSETCDLTKRKRALEICEHVLTNDKLKDCIKLFNFENLLRSCIDDYCNCPNQKHPETCNCDSVEMLAKECVFKGIRLENGWRNLEICPISCSYGRVYNPCGPDVEPTCDSAVIPTKTKCTEGCFCPEGFVQYKDACITRELCPCTMRGKEFKPESTIKKNCNNCICKSGNWNCTNDLCGSRCAAVGDPHYQTFDGKRYDFMGKCSYHLLKTPHLSVEAENVACSGAISENLNIAVSSDDPSCTKSVKVRFTQRNGVPTTVTLDQGLTAQINGKPVSNFPKIIGGGEVLIRHASSTFMTAEFPDGIRIWWDGVSRVYIDAPPSYRNKTAGLCGTFNSNTQDDFLTPEGDVETAVEPFADKWRTKDTCDHKSVTNGPNPCNLDIAKREKAEKYCAWILDDIFQDCHWTVEPEQYYEDCMYDVCSCKEEPDKCFCPILSAYGTECMRQGVKTGWRLSVKECAVKCPSGQVFDECGDSCQRTCQDVTTKNTCKRECVEGCRCPHGEFLDDKNQCVPQQKCPCTFDGVELKPGYKEVRPGEKFLDLCECVGGVWECEDAEPGDKEKYPPSSELRAACANKPFAEFSKCVPKEPKTCKNMHSYVEDLEECSPGCSCMAGYVYDTSREVCVLPESCSCHHGGKSYSDGEKMQEACNECVCYSGNWKCSSNGCESTCTVWGDSHFTTFDNLDYDFQGACDYILSKGVSATGDGFRITIQNVLCGTMGVTCSKSVEIAISGSVDDAITLTADSGYQQDPSKSTINRIRDTVNAKAHGSFHIYKAGVFIVIEVIPLKLQIKWDEGTRVYVKLGTEWKQKVSGLCGNYNDNAMDDMMTPSQGLETSALIFGHSWKVQQFCSAPAQPIDACKEHPERESWAQLKCDILKSSVFEKCHSEVSVEKYLKRCIFDSCACDQGGDCDCLCTAIAAYAHSCSEKGISIRWRTPHLCPMQCDPHCAEYKSCTPSCAVETCDNFLDQGIPDRMCNNENCIEGCDIKPCDKGMIYLNDTYKDCVPKAECKPICMLRDGLTYYEGDVTFSDACSTCRCSKKKEICSGVKCVEMVSTDKPAKVIEGTTQSPINTEVQPKCVLGWTRWFDKDQDSSTSMIRLNDEEKLPRYDRMESIYGTCTKKYMKKIECRVVKTNESSDYMDENVFCNLEEGLACVGQCHDYEIRVFCQCDEFDETTQSPTEKPQTGKQCNAQTAEYKEFPGDCHKFLHCQPRSNGGDWMYVEKTCGEFMMFNPIGNICDHIATVQQIKTDCGEPKVIGPPEKLNDCAEGQVMSDCANQCEHTCHYYGSILQRRGLCGKGEHCKPGCVEVSRPDCPQQGKFWRDESTCVESDECPCMDKTEKYVQPHMPVVGEWEVCQCIDNEYACIPNVVEEITMPPLIVLTTPTVDYHSGVTEVFPVSTTPPLQCAPERLVAMVQGDTPLPDTAFNASSQRGSSFAPANARLYFDSKEQTGSWSPSINDQMQYLQISFEDAEPLFGVIMAGSPDFDNYVTLFKILYSHDGIAYHYLVDETDLPQLFNGPLDSRKPIKTLFKIPIEAKSVRIYPLKWHGSIAMRAELLGCGEIKVTTTTEKPVTEITTAAFHEDKNEVNCYDKMGVENGALHQSQVTASSIWQSPNVGKKPRLIDLLKMSSPVGWKPVVNTFSAYVQFDFLEPRNISGLITKGGPDGWATAYNILFSKNKVIWNTILQPSGEAMVFPGNYDADGEKTNYFKTPILTQYLKVKPTQWEQNINMRIEPLGCFEPYLEVADIQTELELAKTKCAVCEGVTTNGTISQCKCLEGLFWNGTSCVQSNLCPCVENYIPYAIGTKFENKKCEECVCVLGSHANCKSKKCPACKGDLRPVLSAGCYCRCEPCPKHQKLCKSSGDCIPEVLWCNGVQDCTDDEDQTCRDEFEVAPERIQRSNETVTISCQIPECPPQMRIKFVEKKARKMSEMFTSTYTKQFTVVNDGNKITKTNVITSSEEYLPMPHQNPDNHNVIEEGECEEFSCEPIPKIVVSKDTSIECVQPKCPEKYDVELDVSSRIQGSCQKYRCVLRPNKDDTCEISGKTITTFDDTEFTYAICSHILARDLVNSSWVISVHLQCDDDTRKICRKMITIKDLLSSATLSIMPNMKVNFNGFEYTVSQLINSPICKASFVISQPGNTVLVVSLKYGFWVLYDEIGYIKVGISSKYIKTVDGLCGFYNDIPSDDKRAPNGTVINKAEDFGESWFDRKVSKEECDPQKCPINLKKESLRLCSAIKLPIFKKCEKFVNSKQFSTKCMDTTCECLKRTNGDANACKCNLLEDYIKKCLAANPKIQLNTWRAVQKCEIPCRAPLVHMDCYKRRCEPSCDSLNGDDCPIIPDACFAGCYCPEGMVRKGETCVAVAECKDCVCNSFGTSKYSTYDRNSFTFNGNCTYLLSRDIVLPLKYTFQVYVTMDDCQKLGRSGAPAHSSCAKALHILNGAHVVHIQSSADNPYALQISVDGFEVKNLPYKEKWIALSEVNGGKELLLSLPDSHLDLRSSFEDLTFSLSVPSVIYNSKMEGLCGDCNGNPDNDLQQNPSKKKKKGVKPSNELVDVIQSWQADEPKLGLEANECLSTDLPKTECVPLPPEKDPCLLFFNAELFGKCTLIVDPANYVSSCQQDMCKPGAALRSACDSLSAYAKECTTKGICLNWRRPDICPYECPAGMNYEPCGCENTCDTVRSVAEFEVIIKNSVVQTVAMDDMCTAEKRFEGCFCPYETTMEKGKCVPKGQCLKCDDGEHVRGDKWRKDKCTECSCNSDGKTECREQQCLVEENICPEGSNPVNVQTEDQCCPRYACVPEMKEIPSAVCLAPLMPECGPGQFKKQKTGSNGCPQFICECKPKEDCDTLELTTPVKPGEKLIVEEAGCCPTQKIVCDKSSCPKKPDQCEEDFYEVIVEMQPGDCCEKYACAPPKSLCIVQYELSSAAPKFTKKVGEAWLHPNDPCKRELCSYGPDGSTQIFSTTEMCDRSQCGRGFTYVHKDAAKCCGECVQVACVFEDLLYEPGARWSTMDNCTLYQCVEEDGVLIVSSSKEVCPDVSKCPTHLLMPHENGCCQYCKHEPHVEDIKNCLPVSLTETATKDLVKLRLPGHGLCMNKEPIRGFTECMGSCNSGSKYNVATFKQDKICSCCNIQTHISLSVALICEDGYQLMKDVEIPSSCGCMPCSDSVEYKVGNLIDVRLHPLPLAQLIAQNPKK